MVRPGLTTVDVPKDGAGKASIELLLGMRGGVQSDQSPT